MPRPLRKLQVISKVAIELIMSKYDTNLGLDGVVSNVGYIPKNRGPMRTMPIKQVQDVLQVMTQILLYLTKLNTLFS